MYVIANFYFTGNDCATVHYNQDEESNWQDFFEESLGFSPEKTPRLFFVTKMIPALIYCGASIRATTAESTFAYELAVSNADEFKNKVDQVNEYLSVHAI